MIEYPVDKSKVRIDKTLGYQYFLDKEHPLANKQGKVYYHRHIASVKLGRWLYVDEIVHHVDEDKTNNTPHNLKVTTKASHISTHRKYGTEPKLKSGCVVCGTPTQNIKYCSNKCSASTKRKVERPSISELSTLLETKSWCAIGRQYGVSDNAVRKWARQYKII